MIYWATKTFELGGYAKTMDVIGDLQIKLGAPHELMMLERHGPGSCDSEVFIGAPNRGLLKMFPGFTEIDECALPDELIPLVVRNDGFEERFPQIVAKLKR
jgi:hypothetical protein